MDIRSVLLSVLLAACTVAINPTAEVHMTRPTTFPDWATNTNYAGGPDIGTVTKVAPSAGRIADGWRNTDVPPAQEQNHEANLTGQWIRYFDDRIEAFEFHDNAFFFSTASVSSLSITSYFLAIPDCQVGDQLYITWNASVYIVGGGVATFYPQVLDGASDTAPIGSKNVKAATLDDTFPMSFSTVWTVLHAGTVYAYGRLASDNVAHTATMQTPASIVVIRKRL